MRAVLLLQVQPANLSIASLDTSISDVEMTQVPALTTLIVPDDAIDDDDANDDSNPITSFEDDFLDGHFDEIDEAAVGHIEYTTEEEAEQSGQASDCPKQLVRFYKGRD